MIAAKNDATTWTMIALSLLLVSSGQLSPCCAREKGEASGAAEVVCRVEGRSTIHSIVLGGSVVQKGQLLCELDSAGLRAQLATQQTVVKRAEAACELAKKARGAAESTLKEYNEETFKKELEEAKGDFSLLARAGPLLVARRQHQQGTSLACCGRDRRGLAPVYKLSIGCTAST